MNTSRFGLIITLLLTVHVVAAAQKTWTGNGADGLWTTATNWSGVAVPTASDDVVLDNSTLLGSYTVTIPEDALIGVAVCRTLVIGYAGNANTIVLRFMSNQATGNGGLRFGDGAAGNVDFLVEQGGVFINASKAVSGTLYITRASASDSLRVKSGGKFIHVTERSFTTPFPSSNTTFDNGSIYELNVRGTSAQSFTMSGRVFGNYIAAADSAGGTRTYSGTLSGTSTYTVLNTLTIKPGVTWSPSLSTSGLMAIANLSVQGTINFGTSTSTLTIANNASVSGTMNMGTAVLSGSGGIAAPGTIGIGAVTGVNGNIALAGTEDYSQTTFLYNGTANQVTGSDLPTTIRCLTINNPTRDITLSQPTSINDTLRIISGKLLLGANNLRIAANGEILLSSQSDYIVTDGIGTLTRDSVGTTPKSFPIGTPPSFASGYTPVTTLVTIATQSGKDNFSARVVPGISPTSANDPAAVQLTWILSEQTPGGNGNMSVTLQWKLLQEGASFSRPDATSWHNTGTAWFLDGALTAPISGSDPYTASLQTSNITGNWTIANDNGNLPVQLASFTGTIISETRVRLDWTTISETNNFGFEVQRRAGSQPVFESLPNSFISGHGTTLEPHSYSFTDVAAPRERLHYRLKQIDLDGSVHFTEPISVSRLTDVASNFIPTAFSIERNYPNPFNPTTTIKFGLPENAYVSLAIYDVLGRKVAELENGVKEVGYHSTTWNASEVASGVYFARFTATDASGSVRLAKVNKLLLTK